MPDHALIQVAVQTRAVTATAAATENASKQTAVISALRKLGVGATQISTEGYSVNPETRNDRAEQTPRIVSYLVSNTVTVDIADISLVGKILDATISSGANQISSVSLYRLDTETAYREALAMAVTSAKGEAASMAAAAGGRLGPLLELNSGGSNWPSPMAKTAGRMMSLAGAETPISVGEQTVSASVTIRWAFIPDP